MRVEKTSRFKNSEQVNAYIEELEIKSGGAWVWDVCFGEVSIYRFKNRASVPDHFHSLTWDSTGKRIRYKGKWLPFTDAAIIREQNRGITRD